MNFNGAILNQGDVGRDNVRRTVGLKKDLCTRAPKQVSVDRQKSSRGLKFFNIILPDHPRHRLVVALPLALEKLCLDPLLHSRNQKAGRNRRPGVPR
jgi:hypothetical protein